MYQHSTSLYNLPAIVLLVAVAFAFVGTRVCHPASCALCAGHRGEQRRNWTDGDRLSARQLRRHTSDWLASRIVWDLALSLVSSLLTYAWLPRRLRAGHLARGVDSAPGA